MSTFGKRFLEAFGDKQKGEIADILGVSAAAVTNYLQGRIPDEEKLRKISDFTNCSIHWLITGEGEKYLNPGRHINLDVTFRELVRELIREEIGAPVQELGTIDEFDLASAIKKHDNAIPVLYEWYVHEGKPAPNLATLRHFDWKGKTIEQKIKDVRAARANLDHQEMIRLANETRTKLKDPK